jgi:hypothetical protein
MIVGWNELAKHQDTLGGKTMCRLARDQAEQKYLELGGEGELDRDPPILTLPGQFVPIRFTKADIELMRETVKKYDEEEQCLNSK